MVAVRVERNGSGAVAARAARDRVVAGRLAVFVEAGLVPVVPTWWQLRQGEVEMTPFVLSSDATMEPRYAGAPLGHQILRQPLIFSVVGLDHLRTGSALGSKLGSVCDHLHLTYHQGMPVFDLQVIQSHRGGLDVFERRTAELLAGTTRRARRRRRVLDLILPRADEYLEEFRGEGGWIARARRLDYPGPESEGSEFPPEFFSLVAFVNHCARTHPAEPGALPPARRLAHLAHLATRRYREGRPLGWFATRRTRTRTRTRTGSRAGAGGADRAAA